MCINQANQMKKTVAVSGKVAAKLKSIKGETIVVKIGGSSITTDEALNGFVKDVALLHHSGINVVLVHGGGPSISKALENSGGEAHFIDGLRVTDGHTLAVVQNVLDEINIKIVSKLLDFGVPAKGYNSQSELHLSACKKLVQCSSGARLDIGYVGEISGVDTSLLANPKTVVPVFASLAHDAEGQLLNVNADNVAMALAVACKAERLIYITDVPGILMDSNYVIPTVSVDEIGLLIDSGIIRGGMIPKVRNCASGIRKGIGTVVIGSADTDGHFLDSILKPGTSGTMITKKQLVA
ncbi:MAG: acetylglutamate kinase [Candidatus Obscuribacterales bacterium]|nr:acetylglutamate kinase [Candidatus Obscuribacterales bacterium]